MSAVKEALIKQIERMSEDEAQQFLERALHLQKEKEHSVTLQRIANDPTFLFSFEELGKFRKIKPAKGKGKPASEQLIKDRR